VKRLSFFVFVLLCVIVAGCSVPYKPSLGITVVPKEISFSSPEIEVNIQMPQVIGLPDEQFQGSLNATMEYTFVKLKDSMIAGTKEFAKEVLEEKQPMRRFSLFVTYKVTYNNKDILSFYTDTYTFVGGAHGLTERKAYNFNVKTGKDIKLKDLFKEGVDYKAIINRAIRREIARRPRDFYMGRWMKFETIEDDQPFYIESGNVVVYFTLYEIAPYSTGIPEFRIPISL